MNYSLIPLWVREKQHLINLAVVKLLGRRMGESSLALELQWETGSKLYLKLQLQGGMMRVPGVLSRERQERRLGSGVMPAVGLKAAVHACD